MTLTLGGFKRFAVDALQIFGQYEWHVEERYNRDATVIAARDLTTGRWATYEVSGWDIAIR